MEINTAEQFLLQKYFELEEENEQLKDDLLSMERKLDEAKASPTSVPQEESANVWRVDTPYEFVHATVNASRYDLSDEKHPLGMTPAEIRDAVSTEDGLESLCEKQVGWSCRKIVEIGTTMAQFQIKALGKMWAADLYGYSDGDVNISLHLIDFGGKPVDLSHDYPMDRYEEVKAAALAEAKERLLKFADELEANE